MGDSVTTTGEEEVFREFQPEASGGEQGGRKQQEGETSEDTAKIEER